MTDSKPARAANRIGKTLTGAYLDKTDAFTMQELCCRLSRERGSRVTMQEFILQAISRECARHGVKLLCATRAHKKA